MTKQTKQKTLHIELVKIARAKNADSQETLRSLSKIYRVCRANAGQPILIGKRDENEKEKRHFWNFTLGVIADQMDNYADGVRYTLTSESEICKYSLILPVRTHAVNTSRNFADYKSSESPLIMEWEYTNYISEKNESGESFNRKLKNKGIDSIFFHGATYYPSHNLSEHICLVKGKESSKLEFLIGVSLIEKAVAAHPDGELGNYLAQMAALGLKPSENARRQVFEKYFRDMLRNGEPNSRAYYRHDLCQNILNNLEKMDFHDVDIDMEPLPGVKVNPKTFFEQDPIGYFK